jgi:hypothetical protein
MADVWGSLDYNQLKANWDKSVRVPHQDSK